MNQPLPLLGEALGDLVTQTPRAHWSGLIIASWRDSLLAIIETGRLLQQAKETLHYGDWSDMVAQDLPFHLRTAERLMAIAKDPRITDPTHVSILPASWGTLYAITRLGEEDFNAKVADGTINPDATRAQIEDARLAAEMSDDEAGAGQARGPTPVDAKAGQPDMFDADDGSETNKPRDHRATMAGRVETDDLDFYPTGPWITRSLMERVMPHLGVREFTSVWEPASGEGHMAEVLREYFADVTTSDIRDYGYRADGVEFDVGDFLNPDDTYMDVDWIITNPPFGEKLDSFMARALRLAHVGVAIFAQVRICEGLGRYETIYRLRPPTVCAFFVERAACIKGEWDPRNSTATAYWWLLWLKGQQPRPPFWIPPGCRESLTKPDDVERFTQHPVRALPQALIDLRRPGPGLPDPEVLLSDAAARQRGENLDGSQRRETLEAVPPQVPKGWTSPLADDGLELPSFLNRHLVKVTIDWTAAGDNAGLGVNVGTCACGHIFRVPRGALPETNVEASVRMDELIAAHGGKREEAAA